MSDTTDVDPVSLVLEQNRDLQQLVRHGKLPLAINANVGNPTVTFTDDGRPVATGLTQLSSLAGEVPDDRFLNIAHQVYSRHFRVSILTPWVEDGEVPVQIATAPFVFDATFSLEDAGRALEEGVCDWDCRDDAAIRQQIRDKVSIALASEQQARDNGVSNYVLVDRFDRPLSGYATLREATSGLSDHPGAVVFEGFDYRIQYQWRRDRI